MSSDTETSSRSSDSSYLTPSDWQELRVRPYQHQAAGHRDTLYETKDGGIIVKATERTEADNYEHIDNKDHVLSALKGYTPRYHGSISRSFFASSDDQENQALDSDGQYRRLSEWESRSRTGTCDKNDTYIALENVVHGTENLTHVDIKLGTRLWNRTAILKKRERMDREAKETTSASTGIKFAGGDIYHHGRTTPLNQDFCKNLTSETLHEGFSTIFPSIDDNILPHDKHSGSSSTDYNDQMTPSQKLEREKDMLEIVSGMKDRTQDICKSVEMVKKGGWDLTGTSLYLYHGGNKSSDDDGSSEVNGGDSRWGAKLIDLARVGPLVDDVDDQLLEDGVDLGMDTAVSKMKEREKALQQSCDRLSKMVV
ncbi:hypothetical protein CI109_102456 [Kwoniella shandongensis]|uniref:Kinase n=1 Tax=Kwoniella shandongensis TaxID=1734106 RepID=A0A5M6BZM4_9TREE|nr:uncharacterized protein CI109_003225 [Kwoniella shandongensis]KAA5528327.1 hypothetical protein CI109_003225 [Kwoniella shandongensis]